MAKAIAQLQHLGVIEARRGRNGGLSLTDAGPEHPVGNLVRTLEGDREAVVCEGETPCPLSGACRLRRALREAQEAFYSSLNGVTVGDLVASPTGRYCWRWAPHRADGRGSEQHSRPELFA
ncbi:RrF2 family transcriptional regulator [Streptomyces stelliscabiei]|uniref:RrF2 family transcriptional regulator n=1 Tax=Streptomyces stelliscabiei TaxID=146820 RepID=UPI002FEE74E0